MSWINDLSSSVLEALKRGGPQKIAVHTEDQAELGRIAAHRLNNKVPYFATAEALTFEVVGEDIPVGTLLDPGAMSMTDHPPADGPA